MNKTTKLVDSDLENKCREICSKYRDIADWITEQVLYFAQIENDLHLLLGNYLVDGMQATGPCKIHLAIDFVDLVGIVFPSLPKPPLKIRNDPFRKNQWRRAAQAGRKVLFYYLPQDFYPFLLLPPYIDEKQRFDSNDDIVKWLVDEECEVLANLFSVDFSSEFDKIVPPDRDNITYKDILPLMDKLASECPYLAILISGNYDQGWTQYHKLVDSAEPLQAKVALGHSPIPDDIWMRAMGATTQYRDRWRRLYSKYSEEHKHSTEWHEPDIEALTVVNALNSEFLNAFRSDKHAELHLIFLVSSANSMQEVCAKAKTSVNHTDRELLVVPCVNTLSGNNCSTATSTAELTGNANSALTIPIFRSIDYYRALAAVLGTRLFDTKLWMERQSALKMTLDETRQLRYDIDIVRRNTAELDVLNHLFKAAHSIREEELPGFLMTEKREERLQELKRAIEHLNSARLRMSEGLDHVASLLRPNVNRLNRRLGKGEARQLSQDDLGILKALGDYLRDPAQVSSHLHELLSRRSVELFLYSQSVRAITGSNNVLRLNECRRLPFYIRFRDESGILMTDIEELIELCRESTSTEAVRAHLDKMLQEIVDRQKYWGDSRDTASALERVLSFFLFLLLDQQYREVTRAIDLLFPIGCDSVNEARYILEYPEFYWECQLVRLRAQLLSVYQKLFCQCEEKNVMQRDALGQLREQVDRATKLYQRLIDLELSDKMKGYRFQHAMVFGGSFLQWVTGKYDNNYNRELLIMWAEQVYSDARDDLQKAMALCQNRTHIGQQRLVDMALNNLAYLLGDSECVEDVESAYELFVNLSDQDLRRLLNMNEVRHTWAMIKYRLAVLTADQPEMIGEHNRFLDSALLELESFWEDISDSERNASVLGSDILKWMTRLKHMKGALRRSN